MRMRILLSLAIGGLAAGGIGNADAAFINGSLSFSDGGLTVPAPPTTSIVSGLTTVTQGAPAVGSCSGDFTGCGIPNTAGTIALAGPFGGVVYTTTVGALTYTFILSGVSNITPTPLAPSGPVLADALSFNIFGSVDDGPGGADPTAFSGLWTGNGSCIGTTGPATCTETPTASWSVSISALGVPEQIPEPTTLAILGFGLVGLGMLRRGRQFG